MKKRFIVLLLTVSSLFICGFGIVEVKAEKSFAQNIDSMDSAGTHVYVYSQGDCNLYSGYPEYNRKIITGSYTDNGQSYTNNLGHGGCGIYTYAHAIQWLTTSYTNESSAISLLDTLISVDPEPYNTLAPLDRYIKSLGIIEVSRPTTASTIEQHFRSGGVVILHPTGNGGHYCLAIGAAYGSLDGGSNRLWIHVLDSSVGSTTKRIGSYPAYGFVNPHTLLQPGTCYYGADYWISVEAYLNAFSVTSDMKAYLPGTPPTPTASTLQFTNVTYPQTFRIDTTNGWAVDSGVVESNNTLTSIRSQILNSAGTPVSDSGIKSISGYSYSIRTLDDYSGTDNGVRFSFINAEGDYTWRLIATDSSGKSLTLDMPFYATWSGSTSTSASGVIYQDNQYLDLNGWLDGAENGGLGDYGTADVYINGSLVADDVSDYYEAWPVGTSYEIKDIKASADHIYDRIYSGQLSGTIGSSTMVVVLSFNSVVHVTSVSLSRSLLESAYPTASAISISGTVSPANATYPSMTWTSSNGAVASVSSGKITPVGPGYARISCTADGKTGYCDVLVHASEQLVLPEAIVTIDEEAFYGSAIVEAVIPSGAKNIGARAFANCDSLKIVSIPDSVTSIASSAFSGSEDVVILCATGSSAESFAADRGITYITSVGTVTSRIVVSFDANGGTVSTQSKEIQADAAIGTLPVPTRDYHTFDGWYTAASGGTLINSDSTFSRYDGSDVTLYAHWTQNGFANWSSWSTIAVTGNDNREVQTEIRSEQTGTKTTYSYRRYAYHGNTWNNVSYSSSYADANGMEGYWQYITLDYPLTQEPKDGYNDRYVGYYMEIPGATLDWVQSVWYLQETGSEPTYGNVTYYRYRDRIK